VTLDALYVEGLVHITELGGEYFRFDELRQELRGERTGMRYAIGTRVQIQVSRVDLDGRKIDFRLVNELDGLQGKSSTEKGGARDFKQRPSRNSADTVNSFGPLTDPVAVEAKKVQRNTDRKPMPRATVKLDAKKKSVKKRR
jgi:ribonuclease R